MLFFGLLHLHVHIKGFQTVDTMSTFRMQYMKGSFRGSYLLPSK